MVKVDVIPEAQEQFALLPAPIKTRVRNVFARLAEWPAVSGAKPLRREFKGCFRIRVGDWRVLFQPRGNAVRVIRIDNRKDVYED